METPSVKSLVKPIGRVTYAYVQAVMVKVYTPALTDRLPINTVNPERYASLSPNTMIAANVESVAI